MGAHVHGSGLSSTNILLPREHSANVLTKVFIANNPKMIQAEIAPTQTLKRLHLIGPGIHNRCGAIRQ